MNKHKYSEEQAKFICSNIRGNFIKDLTEMFNQQFNTNLKPSQIRAYVRRRKLRSGIDTTFKKGIVPYTKGKTWDEYMSKEGQVNSRKTTFKKGHKKDEKPIGYERVDKNGYLLIKVSNSGKWNERWKRKHIILWEEANGKIPEGYKLMFLDQNRQNTSLENLKLIKDSELLIMNKNHLLTNDKDINKSAILLSKVLDKQNSLKN